MEERDLMLLSHAMYILVQRLGGKVEITKAEMKRVDTGETALSLTVDETLEVLTITATSLAEAKKRAKKSGARKITP